MERIEGVRVVHRALFRVFVAVSITLEVKSAPALQPVEYLENCGSREIAPRGFGGHVEGNRKVGSE